MIDTLIFHGIETSFFNGTTPGSREAASENFRQGTEPELSYSTLMWLKVSSIT